MAQGEEAYELITLYHPGAGGQVVAPARNGVVDLNAHAAELIDEGGQDIAIHQEVVVDGYIQVHLKGGDQTCDALERVHRVQPQGVALRGGDEDIRRQGDDGGIALLAVVYLLTMEWLPMGTEGGVPRNLLFVILIIALILALLWMLVIYYEKILRWSLANRWKFMILPIATVTFRIGYLDGFRQNIRHCGKRL